MTQPWQTAVGSRSRFMQGALFPGSHPRGTLTDLRLNGHLAGALAPADHVRWSRTQPRTGRQAWQDGLCPCRKPPIFFLFCFLLSPPWASGLPRPRGALCYLCRRNTRSRGELAALGIKKIRHSRNDRSKPSVRHHCGLGAK